MVAKHKPPWTWDTLQDSDIVQILSSHEEQHNQHVNGDSSGTHGGGLEGGGEGAGVTDSQSHLLCRYSMPRRSCTKESRASASL